MYGEYIIFILENCNCGYTPGFNICVKSTLYQPTKSHGLPLYPIYIYVYLTHFFSFSFFILLSAVYNVYTRDLVVVGNYIHTIVLIVYMYEYIYTCVLPRARD